jgi:hypothetical protein
MTRKFFCLSILFAPLMVILAITATQAQITAPGPYYAVPSWDQTFPAATRFVILSNMNSEAVLDRETGLVWERAPVKDPSGYNWELANRSCMALELGGRGGWRLPSFTEVRTLVLQDGPPAGHPFDLPAVAWPAVWTSTLDTKPQPTDSIWVVHLSSGAVFTSAPTFVGWQSWCVRGQEVR